MCKQIINGGVTNNINVNGCKAGKVLFITGNTTNGKLIAGNLLFRLTHAVKLIQGGLTDIYHPNCKSK